MLSEEELWHALGAGKHQLSTSIHILMAKSSVSFLKLLTKILQLIRAAAGMQWKNISPSPPPSLPLFLSGSSSTPPSSRSYITLVCEHSSQHSFSQAHSSNTDTPPTSEELFPTGLAPLTAFLVLAESSFSQLL